MRPFTDLTRWDLFAIVIPIIGISPLLYLQGNILLAKEHLQFFPLAFIATGWFLYTEGNVKTSPSKTRLNVAFIFSITGILLCYFSLIAYSSWLAHLAAILLCFAWALGKFGNLTALRILGISGLLAVTLPPPFNWDKSLVQALQYLSSLICSRLMDVTHILHVQSGNVIEIASRSLFVEEACSGVDSQYALMAVAGTLLLVGKASLWVSLITIITVPIWAILGNLLRIYSIVIGLEFFGIDLASGTTHTILGLITFSLAAWAHWSSVQFLNYCESRVSAARQTAVLDFPYPEEAKPESIFNGIKMNRSALLFPACMLLMTPVGFLGVAAFLKPAAPLPALDAVTLGLLPSSSVLPLSFKGCRNTGFQTQDRARGIDGQHSRIWSYTGMDSTQIASLDLPFRGFHTLWLCYELTGWTNLGTTSIETDSLGQKIAWPFFETKLSNADGSFALVHFSFFCESGTPYTYDSNKLFTPTLNIYNRLLLPRVKEFVKEIQAPPEPETFQFQLLSKSQEMISEEKAIVFREMYVDFRERIRSSSLKAFSNFVNNGQL